MEISITKHIESLDAEPLVFLSKIDGDKCDETKQIAILTDAVFELDLSSSAPSTEKDADKESESKNYLVLREINFDSLVSFLNPEEETITALRDIYNSTNLIGPNQDKVSISQLAISCSGRVKLSIAAPKFDSEMSVVGDEQESLKIGLGFTFKSKTNSEFFLVKDMICSEKVQPKKST